MGTRPISADPCNQRYAWSYPAVSWTYLPYLYVKIFRIYSSFLHIDTEDTSKIPQDKTHGNFNVTVRFS